MDNRRSFYVTEPPIDMESMIPQIPYAYDGPHLELFYNLIFSDLNWTLPDHLRPVAWALADKHIKRMMLIISPGAGKSQLVDVAFPIYEIGHDQNTTILAVSSGADLMVDFLKATMQMIEENKVVKLLFPNIKPDINQGWSAGAGAFVKRTVTGQASPTYAATGYGAKKITGKHAKTLIIDDIHDAENSSTPDQLEKVETFYYNTLIGRQDPGGSRMIMVGRRWDESDLYGRLKNSGDWLVMTLASIRNSKELYYDVRIPANLACVFNDYQAKSEVEDIKVVYGENEIQGQVGFYWKGMTAKYEEADMNRKNKPDIFETVYQSNPENAGKKIFREEDFVDYNLPEEMYLGRNYDVVANWIHNMGFDSLIQTLDTALTDETKNDSSCCYTLGLKGCTKEHRALELVGAEPTEVPFHFDIYVLDELYKQLTYDDLQPEIIDYFNMWLPEKLLIENANVGIPLLNSLGSYSIPVEGVIVQHTSKKSRATNGAKAGSAQGWARLGRIYVPRNASWAKNLLNELKDFSGARNKKDDRVDALIQGVNYAIDLGVQSRDLPPGWRDKEDIDARLLSWMAPNHPLLQLPHLYRNVSNPFYGMCGTCKMFDLKKNFCNLHKRKITKLDSCPMYSPTQEPTLSIEYGGSEQKRDN
jgi:predicted phage terminase large subunit-like protein